MTISSNGNMAKSSTVVIPDGSVATRAATAEVKTPDKKQDEKGEQKPKDDPYDSDKSFQMNRISNTDKKIDSYNTGDVTDADEKVIEDEVAEENPAPLAAPAKEFVATTEAIEEQDARLKQDAMMGDTNVSRTTRKETVQEQDARLKREAMAGKTARSAATVDQSGPEMIPDGCRFASDMIKPGAVTEGSKTNDDKGLGLDNSSRVAIVETVEERDSRLKRKAMMGDTNASRTTRKETIEEQDARLKREAMTGKTARSAATVDQSGPEMIPDGCRFASDMIKPGAVTEGSKTNDDKGLGLDNSSRVAMLETVDERDSRLKRKAMMGDTNASRTTKKETIEEQDARLKREAMTRKTAHPAATKQKVSTKTETSDFVKEKMRIRSENCRHQNNRINQEQERSVQDAVDDSRYNEEDSKEEEEELRPGAVSVPGKCFDGHHYMANYNIAPNPVDIVEEMPAPADMPAPVAMVVDNEELEREFRAHMMKNTVTASIVDDMDEANNNKTRRCTALAACFVVVVVVVVAVAFRSTKGRVTPIEITSVPSMVPSMVPSIAPSALPTTTPLPTLEMIKNYGAVRCSTGPVVPESPFVQELAIGLCRALAAAIFGDPDRHEAYPYPYETAQAFHANKTLDVITQFTAFEMDDVLKAPNGVGFTNTDPVYFDGFSFGGISPYVQCADRLDGFFGECRKLRICVDKVFRGAQVVGEWFPSSKIREVPLPLNNLVDKMNSGECNVIGVPRSLITPLALLLVYDYTGEYTLGNTVISKTFYSLQTRDDDDQWSDFVNWVTRAIVAAENRGITKETAHKFTKTSVFGEEFENMFSNAIAAVGNYGEFYATITRGIVPREALNQINNGSTGLISSFPMGQRTHVIGPDPAQGSVMEIIAKRGVLRCGITSKTNEDVWKGMDKDYCRALSASLFGGNSTKIEFVEMDTVEDGFVALDRNEIDVLGGVRITLEADVLEPTTGKGYTFSMPYFYGPLDNDSFGSQSIALVTREDDSLWSSFVFWIVSATILAEEDGTTQQYGKEMPTVNLFGLSFQDMFRHAVSAVGNYDEIYHRSPFIPQRSGQNMLNLNSVGRLLYDRF